MNPDFQERLANEPFRFDFFWAMRLLQSLHADKPKIGESVRFRDDYVRLRQEPDLRFAPSTLQQFRAGGEGRTASLTVNFLGLLGPNGPMPLFVTSYAMDRLNQRDESVGRLSAPDRTLVGFLNVLHHRMLSLFFRAWAVHQKTVDLDRTDDRRFASYVATFIGLGMPALAPSLYSPPLSRPRPAVPATGDSEINDDRHGQPAFGDPPGEVPPRRDSRDAVPDLSKLYFSGRLAALPKNPEGLAAILAEFFGVRCEIENFSGHWIKMPAEDVCRLGESPDTGMLGVSCIIGSRVWQVQTKFRVRLGPMTYADFQRLLPNQPAWQRLKNWVANYIGSELLWDVQLVLRRDEVPGLHLGGAYLGWTTWVNTRPPVSDAEDVVIDTDLN